MKPLSQCRLYAILDTGYVGSDSLVSMARAMVRGGVDILQLRAKKETDEQVLKLAPPIRDMASAAGVPLMINDRPGIAGQLDAAGVHVGQDDVSIAEARRQLRSKRYVGQSTHSVEQIRRSMANGADYIGVGPVYKTPTKPDYRPVGLELVRTASQISNIPFFCIGGITIDNLDEVLEAGATRVAVVSGILLASDPEDTTRRLKNLLEKHVTSRSGT